MWKKEQKYHCKKTMADDFEEAVSETPKGKGTCELTVVMTMCIDLHKLKPNKIPEQWRGSGHEAPPLAEEHLISAEKAEVSFL